MSDASPSKSRRANNFPLLVVGALGVVFGDIGTSPLYTIQSCFFGPHSFSHSPENIIGVASAVLWALILVVTLKYALVVMRADHRGEGGILALTTLADSPDNSARKRLVFATIGIVGAALLYSDGVITPAISVLSAMEGLSAVTPRLTPYIIPCSLVVLCFLFIIQSRGTGQISAIFGPVMVLWFLVLGLLGLYGIWQYPGILAALNPVHAFRFFHQSGFAGFMILGSIFLAVTGAEVLYADIGHFGKSSIRVAWLAVAFPMLVLNYLGQSALLLSRGSSPGISTFYALCPKPLLVPMIVLAALATIIASQAVISGMFSLARQAIHLDYWPRLRQIHTSAVKSGQVYVPVVNFLLFVGTVFLVLFFKESKNLASAYGIAVSATMLLTTGLILSLSWKRWKHGKLIAVALGVVFIPMDLGFFSANIAKIAAGGWIVVAMSLMLYLLMSTWRRGRQILQQRIRSQSLDTPLFVSSVQSEKPLRVGGVAVFLTGNPDGTPRALLHNFKHNKMIHERVFIVTVIFEEIPYVEPERRLMHEDMGSGIHRVNLRYGFFESADVHATLKQISIPGLEINPLQISYFVGRETLVVTKRPVMRLWRKRIFRFLSMNALDASEYFQLPPNQVVEIGLQVEL